MRNSSPTCVDANLIIRVVAEPRDDPAWRQWETWQAQGRSLAAPTLLRYEVRNALYRAERQGLWSAIATRAALRAILAIPLDLHDEADLHLTAMDFAARFSLPAAYDAHYLALADKLGGEFWTADWRLANAVRSVLPWVHLVEE